MLKGYTPFTLSTQMFSLQKIRQMKYYSLLFFCFITSLAYTQSVGNDTIYLKDNTSYIGRVVNEEWKNYQFVIDGTKKIVDIPKSEVVRLAQKPKTAKSINPSQLRVLTNRLLDSTNVDKLEWDIYQSDLFSVGVGDTVVLGKVSSNASDRYNSIYFGSYSLVMTNLVASALGGVTPMLPANSRDIAGKEYVVVSIMTKGIKRNRVVVMDFENSKGLKVCTMDGRQSISLGEFYLKGFMTREAAISKLKEYKDLLDLGVIQQSEFDAKKTELIKYIK